jgi:hypothetical protein
MLPQRTALLISILIGVALEVGTALATGRREAWDAPVYWQLGVPLAIVASAAVGYLARGNGWFTTVVVVPAQVLTMMFRSREVGSLWPLTLTLSLFLSLPFVAAAFVGRRLRLRR